jgi:hypothetical protein
MKNRTKSLLLAALICVTASGCTNPRTWGETDEMPLPAGIGFEPSDLKRSPCACMEVPQDFSDWAA